MIVHVLAERAVCTVYSPRDGCILGLMGITVVRELHFWITFGPMLNIFIFILKPASQPASQHPQAPLRGQALANDQQSKAFFFSGKLASALKSKSR